MRRPRYGQSALSLAAAVAAAIIAACGDGTGPANELDVSVGVDWVTGPNFNQAPESGNRVACDVGLHAIATGSGKATWGAATFKWFAGKDRSAPVDSSVAPAVDVRRGWRDSSIVVGRRQTATWTLWAAVPFSGAIDFHYRVGGGPERTASLAFDCGPAIPASATPPSIPNITAQAPSGALEPGGLVTVDFTAISAIGVWRTAVLVSGPCEVYREFDERFETTVKRSATLQLPTNCELGAPVDVTVYVTDAALDRRARQVPSSYTLVDVTRPWIRGATAPRPTGPYFTGDTIDFVVTAGDNHVVKSIVWEARPFGVRDSILSPAGGSDVKIRIPVRPGWSGPIELRYFARDVAGLASDTIVSAPGSMTIYPGVDRPTTSMTLDDSGDLIDGEVVDLARGVAYLRQPLSRRIAVVSLASMQVVSTIPLAPYPADMDLTAGGDSLLVALPELQALGIIDLRRPDRRLELLTVDLVAGYPVPARWTASEVRALANGKAFLLVAIEFGPRLLLEVDLATGAQRVRFEAGPEGSIGGGFVEAAALTRSPDGSAMAVRRSNCVERYDGATDRFGPCVQPQTLGIVTSADASGQRFSIGLDVYDAAWHHVQRVGMLPPGSGAVSALTLDGRELFFAYGRGIVRASAVDGRILDRQLLPVRPSRVRMSPDGKSLIVVGTSVATGLPAIAVIDLLTPHGDQPRRLTRLTHAAHDSAV